MVALVSRLFLPCLQQFRLRLPYREKKIFCQSGPYIAGKNYAYELYKAKHGEEEFKRKIEEGEKPPPEPGAFSCAQLRIHTEKYKLLFGAKALATQQRPTHKLGVGALGMATVVSSPKFPAHELFTPGRVFPVRIRHANLGNDDDAGLDVRGASLKFADSDSESPLDLVMNTGRENVFWDMPSLDDLTAARLPQDKEQGWKDYMAKDPLYYYTAMEGMRRAPNSYYDQHYYSQIVFNFKEESGKAYYVRYRMKPAEDIPESGRLDRDDQRNSHIQTRMGDDKRPTDYLKREYEHRLSKGPLKYKVQIQLHEPQPQDPPQLLHAGRSWDLKTHPWMDLADVTITRPLAPDVVEQTYYNVANQHSSLGLLPAVSIYDYNCIAQVRSHVYSFSQYMRSLKPVAEQPDHLATYVIRMETGNQEGAGTDATITITLTGTKGRTDAYPLDKWFHDDFEAGQTDEYTIEAMDVGEVLLVTLNNDGGGWYKQNPDWFCNRVTVINTKNGEIYEFPCYRWILSEAVLFQAKAVCPDEKQPEIVRKQRKMEVQEKRKEFRWGTGEAYTELPGYIEADTHADLPRNVQFTDVASKTFKEGKRAGFINLGLTSIYNLLEDWDDFDDYRRLYTSWVGGVPAIIDRWKEDKWFGENYINGVNPEALWRCTKQPDNFPVTEQLVENLLDRGMNLAQEMQAGHVYLADYKILEGIPRYSVEGEERYVTEPLGMFYVKKNGDLVPIAIQLNQKPSETNPIWTPNDSEYDWLFAKMWFRTADTQVHQMIIHLLRTHLCMEPVSMATFRNLPSLHPVYKLLMPHIRGLHAINTLGRDQMISPGGTTDEVLAVGGGGHIALMQKWYKSMTWDMFDIPQFLEKRGVHDPEKLPGFHYREDATRLWNIVSEFLRKLLGVYYHSDTNVQSDSELQNWVKDLHDCGYPVRKGDVEHNFPSNVDTIDKLVHLLTTFVFISSCQHAAVNFTQMDIYGFPPNSPSFMKQPPPTKKGVADRAAIMNALPGKRKAARFIVTIYVLTRLAAEERYLGDYPDRLFCEEDAQKAIDSFHLKLCELSAAIKKRNKDLHVPYAYLLPERIPNSIAI